MNLGGGKEWFTAAELAELALPGLSKAKRNINERAAAEVWALRKTPLGAPLARPRAGRGGGMEYHIDVLPAAARAALVARGVSAVADVTATPPIRQAEGLWSWFEAQTDEVKDEARRRAGILDIVQSYERAGMSATAAVASVPADMAKSSTIWEWRALVRGVAPADRLPNLAPRRAGGGVKAEIDPQAWHEFESDYLRPEKPTMAETYRRTEAWAKRNGVTLPHLRTFRRRMAAMDQRIVILRRSGAEALRQMLPSQQRSVADLHALEAVNIDGHKFDVFVNWGNDANGKPIIRRPMMIGIQDVHSRKLLAWRVCETENMIDARLTFAQLFRTWGIPRHCVLDNGRAFASKWLTGGAKTRYRNKIKEDEPLGLLTQFGIEIHWATPYRGQSKPIERAWLDLTDIIARHPETAGAYTGNKPDAKPENYGNAAVPIAQFMRLVDAGIAAHNAREGRRTEMAHGRYSFDQVFAASYATAAIGKPTDEQLRLALLTAEERPCDRKTGEVTLEGNRYWAPELGDYAGKWVTLRFDPDRLHDDVHVYDAKGRFIVTAMAIAKVGFFDKTAAVERRKLERNHHKAARAAVDAEHLLNAAEIADMIRDHGDDEAPLPEAGAVRMVRTRGHSAVALKPTSQRAPRAVQEAAQAASMDRMAIGLGKLRAVK